MNIVPTPERVSRRLKDTFAAAYLTLTSIIQGVALSTLVMRVEATYTQFTATDWLLTTATFVCFLVVWQEYLMQVLAFVWMPNLLDALVPFSFLASELFLAHFVYHGQRGWLLTLGLTFVVGGVAQVVTFMQARTLDDENRDVARVLARHSTVRSALGAVIAVLCLCAWIFYDVLRLSQVQFTVASVGCAGIIVFLGSSVPYWNQVLAYALDERRIRRHRVTVEA